MTTLLIAVAVILTPLAPSGTDDRPLIFALGLLPLLNAAFDYLSYGTTITLIRRGRKDVTRRGWRILLWGLVDAGLAVVFLIGLGVTLVLVVSVINTFAVLGPLFDLDQVFADMRDPATRGAYTWLILSCLTTLVPTLVHLLIVAFSAFAWVPMRMKMRVAGGLDAGGDLPVLGTTLVWSVMGLAYVTVCTMALTGVIWFASKGLEPFALFVLNTVAKFAGIG